MLKGKSGYKPERGRDRDFEAWMRNLVKDAAYREQDLSEFFMHLADVPSVSFRSEKKWEQALSHWIEHRKMPSI